MSNKESLTRAFTAYQVSLNGSGVEHLKADLKRRRQSKAKLVEALAEGWLSMDDARVQMQKVEAAISDLQAQIAEAAQGPLSPDLMPDAVNLKMLTMAEQREYLCACLERIRIRKPYLYLDYKCPVLESGKTTVRLML